MAIYHLHASVVSRGKGFSAVAKSAYNSREEMTNEYDGKVHNYSSQTDHSYSEVLLCKNAPEEYRDKAKLWNAVEQSEKSKNAQLCRSFDIALPQELSKEENEKLIHDFCKENFSERGMCVQIDIHNKEGNPHAHVMTTMREIDENGEWKAKQHKEYLCTNGKEKDYFRPNEIPSDWQKVLLKNGKPKTRAVDNNDWNDTKTFNKWRENWAEKCNEKLREKGVKEISHKTLEEQKIHRLPQVHLGSYNHKLMKQGKTNERINTYLNIIEQNRIYKELRQKLKQVYENYKNKVEEKHDPKLTDKEKEFLKQLKEKEKNKTIPELKQDREDKIMSLRSKEKELNQLTGIKAIFKGKEKEKLNDEIAELKEDIDKLDKRISQKQAERMKEQNKELFKKMETKEQSQVIQKEPEKIMDREEKSETRVQTPTGNRYGIKAKDWGDKDLRNLSKTENQKYKAQKTEEKKQAREPLKSRETVRTESKEKEKGKSR